ncbi:hypothetical protein BTO15_15745 [Polaribacter sejongensis]|uniref:SMP domain-containing protein n=1 Tax=Polaribacter sejongensis TaxID=985043 RepID=A0ABN5F905_9FLAO|nr:hypothetical protein [Polaribacter sejongensis]AUC23465.1 hypothetical protein BTO15_15745 [Polaribacter sejongensis]
MTEDSLQIKAFESNLKQQVIMSKSRPITNKSATRIHSSTAKSTTSENVVKGSFAARAQSVGSKNTNK